MRAMTLLRKCGAPGDDCIDTKDIPYDIAGVGLPCRDQQGCKVPVLPLPQRGFVRGTETLDRLRPHPLACAQFCS